MIRGGWGIPGKRFISRGAHRVRRRRNACTGAFLRWRARLFAALWAVIFWAPLVASPGPPAKEYFDVQAQTLPNALAVWSAQTGLRYVCYFDPQAAPDTSAIKGEFTPAEALKRMLQGTGRDFYMKDDLAVIRLGKDAKAGAAPVPKPEPKPPEALPIPAPPRKEEMKAPVRIDEVVVTGTKLRGGRVVGSPRLRLSDTLISMWGQPGIDQSLQGLPEFTRGGIGGGSADSRLSFGSRSSGNITFASPVTLRALGPAATLMLVNDRRTAISAQGLPDASTIPIAAVSHVEVLKDGASAIYGADAIAGVVNFVLKEEHDENETRARYAMTTRAGRQEVGASQTFGHSWEQGSIIAVGEYQNQTALTVEERSRTKDVPRPENIHPSNKQLSAYLAGWYAPAQNVKLRGQALRSRIERDAEGFLTGGRLSLPVTMDRMHGAFSAHHEGDRWKTEVTAYGSREDTDFSFLAFSSPSPAWDVERSQIQHLTQSLWVASLETNTAIRIAPGVDLAVALGGEHREEAYRRALRSPGRQREQVSRSVDSAWLEAQWPGNDEETTRGGLDAVAVSLAGRLEKYSDVGSVMNPKFGFAWTPLEGLEVHWSLGRSLRAPTIGEEMSSAARGAQSRVGIYSFSSADGESSLPVAVLLGSTRLESETARHWTAGLTFEPELLPGWAFDVTWFDINYRGRIVAAPVNFDALREGELQSFVKSFPSAEELHAWIAGETGGEIVFVDRTGMNQTGGEFGANPQHALTLLYDGRLMNASVLRNSGFDAGIRYVAGEGPQLQLGLSATWTKKLRTVFAPGAAAVDVIGTSGYPVRGRLLATVALAREHGWSVATALRVMDSHTDTSGARPHRARSSMTVDAQVSYTFGSQHTPLLADLSCILSLSNVFDERPPYITGSIANRYAHYDTTHADPLGRRISLELRKRL